jgi:hypothetical protein
VHLPELAKQVICHVEKQRGTEGVTHDLFGYGGTFGFWDLQGREIIQRAWGYYGIFHTRGKAIIHFSYIIS